jgi:hypothetical protein
MFRFCSLSQGRPALLSPPIIHFRSPKMPKPLVAKSRRRPLFRTQKTDVKRLDLYRGREARRLHLDYNDIEPQSKNMSKAAKIDFQNRLFQDLRALDRQPSRGELALDLELATTRHDAPQAHTIAKNLLDVFGAADDSLGGPERKVLYEDDSKIHALAVSCVHGEAEPRISIGARSMSAFREDLVLAATALRDLDMADPTQYEPYAEMRHFRDLIENEPSHRSRLGDSLYDAFFKMSSWSAQQAVLSQASVTTATLAWLFDVPKTGIANPFPAMWDKMFRNSSLRLQVGELPIRSGEAADFKQRIEASVIAFKQKWDWLISPLVVPVALQVVVRPSPGTPRGVLHDLDNIVRDYLIKQIVPNFGTVSDHRWLIDFEEMRRRDAKMAAWWGDNPTLPKGTRVGVTRYEAWRLPAAKKGKRGFVSAAIVFDDPVAGGIFRQIDDQVGKWADNLKEQ